MIPERRQDRANATVLKQIVHHEVKCPRAVHLTYFV